MSWKACCAGRCRSSHRYLWIVDDLPAGANHDTLLEWSAPSSNAVTLVTHPQQAPESLGRRPSLGCPVARKKHSNLLPSAALPKTDAERSAAQEILTLLGNHALAVDVTGAAIKSRRFFTIQEATCGAPPMKTPLEFAAELADDLYPCGHAPQHRRNPPSQHHAASTRTVCVCSICPHYWRPAPIPRISNSHQCSARLCRKVELTGRIVVSSGG